MATVKFDLYGSTQTEGVSSAKYDHAIRRCSVVGLARSDSEPQSSHTLIDRAIQAVRDHPGLSVFHPTLRKLKVQRMRGRQIGPQKAIVDIIYARDRYNIPDGGAFLNARMSERYENIDVYRSSSTFVEVDGELSLQFVPFIDGLPAGDMFEHPDLRNKEKRPLAVDFQRSLMTIQAPFALSYNPINVVFPYQRKLNEGSVLFGGLEFAPKTVRYDNLTVDHVVSNEIFDTGVYFGTYNFTADRFGWVRQEPRFTDPNPPDMGPPDEQWHIFNVQHYETADFLTPGFPS